MRKLLPLLCLLILLTCTGKLFAQTIDYQQQGNTELFNKDFTGALASFKMAIKKADKQNKEQLAVLYFNCALCQEGLNQGDDAMKSYNTAILLNPQYRGAYWNRGVLNQHNGKFQLAINDYNNAIANSQHDNSGQEALYANVSFNEYKLGEYDKAFQADSISMSINFNYGRAYLIRGNIYMATKKYELAKADYTTAIFNYGDQPVMLSNLYGNRADAKRDLKQYKDAINDYSLAIKLNPDNKYAYWDQGAAYHANGDYMLAADDYTKAISYYKGDDKNLSKLYDDRASNELGQNLFSKTIADDSLAIAFDATNQNAYFDMALAYTQGGNYQQGIDYYKKMVGFSQDNKKLLAFFYYTIANNEYFLNEFDKVITDCTLAISFDPTYSASYYYRAKVYLKKMNNKDMANNDFNKVMALDTTKRSVGYIFSLMYTGNADKAIDILQNDLLNAKENMSVLTDYYNLACLYAIINKPDEANIYLKKAIDSGYSKKYAIADEDLDNIRNTDDYKNTIAGAVN
jgi:tetratricopeptide (TPR) repeat protein